ncbi:MAG TPA: hypothetical protein P5247_00495 [Candidatus Saccharimonadales bacterium]|nr:hypothetical protein [Candidatus Saccharimonadales bacterium]
MLEKRYCKFLEMDPVEFDQAVNGWRSLVGEVSEEHIAELILQYIKLSGSKIDEYNKGKVGGEVLPIDLLYFHAGQSFGYAGTKFYKDAIECFQKSYKNEKECWNAYVNGTIAFLKGDKNELKTQIKVIEDSKAENKRGGNIGILRNFSKCLDSGITDYEKAYGMQPEN